MAKRRIDQNRCCVCGRFVPWDADSATPFGSCVDIESPDPDFFCAACAAKEEAYYIEQGTVPSDWIPSEWQQRVAAKIGMRRCKMHGNAWSIYRRELPEGWEWCDA